MKKVLQIILFVVIILAGIIALAVYWTFYRPLPKYDAHLTIPPLHQTVRIFWGPQGVPHIYARDKHDLYFALGYVHAQDRLWQMTLTQLAAQGRFAEFFGKQLIPLDKLQRTIGFWRIAQKMRKQLPDSILHVLQAYSNGVNWYAAHHKKELSVQFALTGLKPIKWNPTYCLAEARLMAWILNPAWQTELAYNALYERLSPQQFKALFPDSLIPAPKPKNTLKDSTLSSVVEPLFQYYSEFKRVMNLQGTNSGSNAWAVDGKHSSTGKPLLAGDPHLSLGIPGKWYEVQLNFNGKNISGATIPGNPAVVLGQNDFIAWSFTSMMLDGTDFYRELPDPQDSTRYLADSTDGKPVYKKFKIQRSVIKVKDGKSRIFTRKLTKHGPIISDIYPNQRAINEQLISMKWTGEIPTQEQQSMLEMDWSQNLNSFLKAVRKFKNPALNIVFADTSGDIGLLSAANIPIRKGNPIILRPGWKPAMDWQGFVPYKQLPKIINPPKGWVANANNPVEKEPYYESVYWAANSRFERIKHYLTAKKRFSSKDFQTMQNDRYSVYAKKVSRLILPALQSAPDSGFATAIDYLKHWDFTYDVSETAASIFDSFMLHLSKNVFEGEMKAELYHQFINFAPKPRRILLRFLKGDSLFVDNKHIPQKQFKSQLLRKSMRQTIQWLKGNYGDEPAKWRWGNLHTITLKPPLLGKAAEKPDASNVLKMIVKHLFDKGPYPAPGNATTLDNGTYSWYHPFDMTLGPSIRRIVNLGNMRRSLSILPTGQSGNPFSDFYGNQTKSWLHGQYKTLYQDSSLFKHYTLMVLVPSGF